MNEQDYWEDLNCCVCSSNKRQRFYPSAVCPNKDMRDMFWGLNSTQNRRKYHAEINKCINCGHIYSSPYLKEEILHDYYSGSDFDNSWQVEEKFPLKTVRRYLEASLGFLPDRDCIVDVGCDVGFLLEGAAELGFSKGFGIEPNKMAAAKAKERLKQQAGMEIINAVYRDDVVPASTVSCLSFIHVLDHITKPDKILKIAHNHLKPNGIIIAATHNINSVISKVSGRRFPPINLQHAQFFSPHSLRLLFERTGFEFLKICSTWNDYPLFHYIRYVPFIPEIVKDKLVSVMDEVHLKSLSLALPLGN
ncbi:class I SAM-dependent methyltransferase, partial [Candidatus Peregrinibacteria bacterium]|nr:class I SAM-dependent methyltransferase [Candidatus Peregrinibacteria bacterium]